MQKKKEPDERSRRILVVDDDEGILDALEAALLMEEYEVAKASSEEAVTIILQNFLPDLIVLDVFLSGKDGRDIVKKLKKLQSTKDIPVLMISAHPGIKESTIEAGATQFLAKPFDMEDLLVAIKKLT